VKTLRPWFLLLLALLLPMRGAVSAAMLCPPAGFGMQTELRMVEHPIGHGMDHHAMDPADPDAASAAHGHGAHDDGSHDHGTSDKCDVCSAFCSLTPLLGSAPTLPAPLPMASTAFPALRVPTPTFLSDGQDRPPRSI